MTTSQHNFRDPVKFNRAVVKIRDWLFEKGWLIQFFSDMDDCIDFTERVIHVNKRRTPQSQIFGALHEMGHLILSEAPDYRLRFKESDALHRRREKQREPLKVKVQTLGEEWEAWSCGEQLASELGIQLNKPAFYAARDKDIKTYAHWVANGS